VIPARISTPLAKRRGLREEGQAKSHNNPTAPMKTLFIDCGVQLEKVFHKVYRADDPPITVNVQPRIEAADLPRLLDGYDICIDDHSYMPTEQIAQCKALRHIVFCGTGAASYMDVAALKELGVTVHTYKGYGDTAVAEHTIALMFACARDIALSDRRIRGGTWQPLEGVQLLGKTLGVIGLGGIGQEVARIAAGIGMKVIGWNRTPRPVAAVPQVAIEELLECSDVISLNLLLSDDTRGFLDAGRIARIKQGAILVNTARGALIEEAALIEALTSGRISRAGLDVFHAEPLKADHPLVGLDNVTLTPHAAFRTPEASENLIRRALDIVRKVHGLPAVSG
jgi:D-3-phosphoglycerate dehydrogenase / 2-oxoglutarate reductase